MLDTTIFIPEAQRRRLADVIAAAGGNEVFFLGKLSWRDDPQGRLACVDEVEPFARGNEHATPAIIEGAERWDVAIHNHPGGDLTPSDADLDIAAELGQRGVAFVIIDNAAERFAVIVRPTDKQQVREVDAEEVRAVFAPGGALSVAFGQPADGGYEGRSGQIDMALEVTRALNESGVVALEAGTGIGKSFAYLVPAILWATRNRRRVIVSTNTINLQEQLIGKDLPFLARALPVEFTYALFKGRGNYACLRKAAEARTEERTLLETDDEARFLEDILDWVEKTSEGSLADLGFVVPDAIWEKVMSETDKSLKVQCQFYDRCFYYNARRRASAADIIVVNHHLFFSDLALRRQSGDYNWNLLLPGYDRVIFDEAHHLEDVASKHLGHRFSLDGLRIRFARMLSPRDHGRGMLPFLAGKLRREGAPAAAHTIEEHYIGVLPDLAGRIEKHFHAVARLVEGEAIRALDAEDGPDSRRAAAPVAASGAAPAAGTAHPGPAGAGGGASEGMGQGTADAGGRGPLIVRLTSAANADAFRHAVVDRLADVHKELDLLGRINDRAVHAIQAAAIAAERKRSLVLELTALRRRIEQVNEAIDAFCDTADATRARWIELRPRRHGAPAWNVICVSSPVRIDGEMEESVYKPLRTVVLGSATLSVQGSMDFVAGRLGLDRLPAERFRFRSLDSPFDYARQARILVPTDFPDPGARRYEEAIADATLEVARKLGGRTFVLFTSHALLRRVRARLDAPLGAIGVRLLCQGEGPRTELLERFRNGPRNLLLGTDSFWEGVDVKGRALECVIITRLPFRVPTEPLQLARVEEIERGGKNPFPHYTVPQAVLKFKQGFGRLIRSSQDRGVVLVLDRRLVTQRYGRAFLESLPAAPLVKAPLREVFEEFDRFFAR